MSSRAAAIVEQLLAARNGGPLVPTPGDLSGFDEVYAIQAGVMATLGPVGGWKVGRSDADAPLIYSPIRKTMMRPSGAIWQPADCRLRGAELEVAFRIDAALPAADDPQFLRRLAACVSPLPVFEIVDSRLVDPQAATPLWRLADFQLNAGLVYGEPLADGWVPEAFDAPTVRLTANGETVCEGPATLNTRTPFIMLADLVRQLGSPGRNHCGGVQPGQIVTTGSFTGLRFFDRGSTLTGTISGLAPISTTFSN
jgi:2-keto-4-pentenoate hydratase